ncbi:hypothetical protein ACC840_36440, partial [Rhizobium ruizarguesonis]
VQSSTRRPSTRRNSPTLLVTRTSSRVLTYGYSINHAQVATVTATNDPDLLSLSPFGILPRQ